MWREQYSALIEWILTRYANSNKLIKRQLKQKVISRLFLHMVHQTLSILTMPQTNGVQCEETTKNCIKEICIYIFFSNNK